LSSLSGILASEVYRRKTEVLPDDVVALAKKFIVDSLGCMYGAIGSQAALGVLRSLPDIDSGTGVTLVGTGRKTGLAGGLLYNGALLRYLDLNDVQLSLARPGSGHGHNSETLPLVLGIAEQRRLTGYQVLRAFSMGYDVSSWLTNSVRGPSLEDRGWNIDLRAALVVPALVGMLLEMPEHAITDAIGASMLRCGLLRIVDVSGEENTLSKNLRFPLTAYMAVTSTFLARAGITGPPRVLEGRGGFNEVVLDGDLDVARLSDGVQPYCIRLAQPKAYAACYATHGHIAATLYLVNQNDLQPTDISRIVIRASRRTAEHVAGDSRRNPTNKETADHSSYFVTALAVTDRAVGASQFTEERLIDPVLRMLMEKTRVVASSEFDAIYPGAHVSIYTQDGRHLQQRAVHPPGHPKNPMSATDVEQKFRKLSSPFIASEQADRILTAVSHLDAASTVDELTELLRLPVG
jgi:2-methylcitrate dehydratase